MTHAAVEHKLATLTESLAQETKRRQGAKQQAGVIEKRRSELEGRLGQAIANARVRERAEVKKKIADLADEHGFSVNELFGGKGMKAKSSGFAKYANPADPADTWTGRGRKPNWLVVKLKRGAKLADFEIH